MSTLSSADVMADVSEALVLEQLATAALTSTARQATGAARALSQAAKPPASPGGGDTDLSADVVDRLERSLAAVTHQLREERRRAFAGAAVLKERDAELTRLRSEVSALRQSHVTLAANAKVRSGALS